MVRYMVRVQLYEVPFLVPDVAVAGNQVVHAHRTVTVYAHEMARHLYPAALLVVRVHVYHKEHVVALVFALLEIGQNLVVFNIAKLDVIGILKGSVLLANVIDSRDQLL